MRYVPVPTIEDKIGSLLPSSHVIYLATWQIFTSQEPAVRPALLPILLQRPACRMVTSGNVRTDNNLSLVWVPFLSIKVEQPIDIKEATSTMQAVKRPRAMPLETRGVVGWGSEGYGVVFVEAEVVQPSLPRRGVGYQICLGITIPGYLSRDVGRGKERGGGQPEGVPYRQWRQCLPPTVLGSYQSPGTCPQLGSSLDA